MLQHFPLITWWLASDAQMVVLLKKCMMNSLLGRNGSKKGPKVHSRKAPDIEHEVSKAVVKTNQMGTGHEGHVWRTGQPEGCHMLDTGGTLGSFCHWTEHAWCAAGKRRLQHKCLNSSLSHESVTCRFPPSKQPSQSVQCRLCAWEEMEELLFTVCCEAMARKGGDMPYFWKMMKKEKVLIILEVEFISYTR